jgi:hypothetical protein
MHTRYEQAAEKSGGGLLEKSEGLRAFFTKDQISHDAGRLRTRENMKNLPQQDCKFELQRHCRPEIDTKTRFEAILDTTSLLGLT